MVKKIKTNIEENTLITIPYPNLQDIIGKLDEVIKYKFGNITLKNIVNDYSPKYILLTADCNTANFNPQQYDFFIAIKVELTAIENDSENSIILELKIIDVVRIYKDTIRYLTEQIIMVKYSPIRSKNFITIKNDIEQLLLDIHDLQDEYMPNLPEFNPELDTESLEDYTYRLIFFIIGSVSTVVKIDNLEDFLNGHALILLKKARYILLQYLKTKAQEEQTKTDPIFQAKLLSGEILPLISLNSMDKEKLIPLMECCQNIYISDSVKSQLMRYQTILQEQECHIVLTSDIDMESQENIEKKHLGILVSLRSIASNTEYSLSTVTVIPVKNVMVSAIQKQEKPDQYDILEYIFYCKVEDLEYTVCDYDKLHLLIMTSLNILRQDYYSDLYIPHYNQDFITNINYLVNLSTHIICYINFTRGDFLTLLRITQLEERFTAIKLALVQVNSKQKKEKSFNTGYMTNELIKEVSTIPEEFNIVLFGDIEKYSSLFTSGTHRVPHSSLVSEQIEKNYYNNNCNILLIKGEATSFSKTESIIPSILAKVNNIKIKEDNTALIDIVPEKRVQVLEIVLKDGVFYGQAAEIIEQAPKNNYEFSTLKKLVNRLITCYEKQKSNNKIPVFNSALINLETYAANLSFYIAEQILFGYSYSTWFVDDKNVNQEFYSKTTIEKISYLIEYIEAIPKNQNANKSTYNTVDTSTFTTSDQWLQLGKSLLDKQLFSQAINHLNQATQLETNNAEAWYYKANSLKYRFPGKYEESIKCYEKAVSLDLDKELLKNALQAIQLHYSCKKHNYQKALKASNALIKLNPGNLYDLYHQAQNYFHLEQYQESLNCCDEIIKLSKHWPQASTLKGHILLTLGKLEEAVKYYSTAIDYYLKLETEQNDLFYRKDCTRGYLYRAIATDLLGKRALAIQEYKKVIQRLDIDLVSDPDRDYLHFLKAMTYFKLAKFKEVNECYDKIHSSKACIHFYADSEFLKFYYEILNLSNHKNAYFIKSAIHEFWQDYAEEMKCYEKILELEADNESALFGLERVYEKLGRYEELANMLARKIKFNLDNKYLESIMFRDIGKVLYKLWQYNEALDYFSKSLISISEELASKILDDNLLDVLNIIKADILAYYADTFSKLENHQQAIEYFDQALLLDPNHTFAYYHKAQLLNKLQKYADTIICCNNGLLINPDDPNFLELKHTALYETFKLSLPEDIQSIEDLIKHLPLSIEANNIATKECNIIKSLRDDNNDKATHRKYLHHILKLPWGKYDNVNIDLKIASKILDQEHYGLEEVKNRILESLSFLTRSNLAKTPIICLVGPPGVGKTSIARSIANALNRKFTSLSLAGGEDTSLIRGFMHTYTDSHPGKILSLITEAGSSNPVMLLDEIDKINKYSRRGSGLESALLQLLDPEHNNRFTDDYFDFSFDLSKIFFIATANSLDEISFPLINRMEIIELSGYTDLEKIQITNQYLIPKILKEANLTEAKLEFDNEIVKYLINHYTKESGVRDIEKLFRNLVQKYLLDEIKGEKPVINYQLIEKYFGSSKYQNTPIDQTAKIGTAIGLAYTARGGTTMTIEVEKFPGDGKLKTTGKLGEVLKESIDAAIAYLKANAQEFAISPQIFKKNDLHIHIPEGAVAKDGPSAGITIYVALASLLSNRKVKQDIAMTGELTLKGKVLPIGGLKEKLAAAARDNITTVIIPEANKRDLVKIPKEIQEVLTIKTISHLRELLDIVFIE